MSKKIKAKPSRAKAKRTRPAEPRLTYEEFLKRFDPPDESCEPDDPEEVGAKLGDLAIAKFREVLAKK